MFLVFDLSARAERFELPSTVLETAILPLNYARKKAKSYPDILEQLLEICHKDKNLLLSLAITEKLTLILRSQSPVLHPLYGHLRE